MAVAYVNGGALSQGGSGSHTPGAPASIVAGNLLVVIATYKSTTGVAASMITTATAGWTAHPDTIEQIGTVVATRLFWKVAVGGDTMPTMTFAGAGGSGFSSLARVFQLEGDFDPAAPFGTSGAEYDPGTNATSVGAIASPGAIATGDLALAVGTRNDDHSGATYDVNSPWTHIDAWWTQSGGDCANLLARYSGAGTDPGGVTFTVATGSPPSTARAGRVYIIAADAAAPAQTLTVPLLTVTPDLYEPTVTDYEIQDPGEVDDPLTGTVIISGETVRSVTEVRLFVDAPDTSKLLVTLKPPDGAPEVTLFDHRGSGADIGASAGAPLILRDDAATTLAAGFVSGTGQTRRPEQALSTFKNEQGGTWTITVTDTTTSETVVLPYARIETTGPKAQKKVLRPKLLTVTPTLLAPTVGAAGTTQTLTVPLLTVAPTLIEPVVIGAQTVTPPLLTVTPALYAPELRHIISPPLLDVPPQLLAPGVIGLQVLTAPLLTVTPELFGPAVNPREVVVAPGLLDVPPTLYPPAVGVGALQLLAPLLDVPPVLHAPQLQVGTVGLVVPLLDVPPQLLAMTVVPGTVFLMPILLVGEPVLFAPVVRRLLGGTRTGIRPGFGGSGSRVRSGFIDRPHREVA